MDFLWVAGGGILGALTRYELGLFFTNLTGNAFPYGTLIVNITGSILLGLIQTLVNERMLFKPRFRLFAGVGFCGAYTTFSTFTRETVVLLLKGRFSPGFLYMFSSLLCCLLGAWLGVLTGRLLFNTASISKSHQASSISHRTLSRQISLKGN